MTFNDPNMIRTSAFVDASLMMGDGAWLIDDKWFMARLFLGE